MPSFRVARKCFGQKAFTFTSKLRANQAENKSPSGKHYQSSLVTGQTTVKNDYSWCVLSGGFMSHWTTHYFDENEKHFHRAVWKFFSIFKLLIIIRIVRILLLFGTPNYEQLREHVYLGTFARYMGGPLHFTELIAFFWSFSEAMMYQFCINPPRHKFADWIQIFLFLNQINIPNLPTSIDADSVGLDLKSINKLKRAAKISFTMSSQYISQIISGFPVIITLLFYFNFSFEDFLYFGIPWALVWTLWTYCRCMVVYWLPSYYFVYCYYLKLRIKTINDELKKTLASTNVAVPIHLQSSAKPSFVLARNDVYICHSLIRHNQICREIFRTNCYWTRYLSLIFFLYTLIICILLFFLMFATMPWYSYFQYAVVILSGHVILLVIVIFSAKIVWSEGRQTYRILSVAILVQFPVYTKLKIMTYLERLKVNRQGFFLVTGQLISAVTFQEVLENIMKYFLLVIQNSK